MKELRVENGEVVEADGGVDPLSVECPICEHLPGYECYHMASEGATTPRDEPHPERVRRAREEADAE